MPAKNWDLNVSFFSNNDHECLLHSLIASVDFESTTSVFTLHPGSVGDTIEFSFPVISDLEMEDTETVVVLITGGAGLSIVNATATVLILDNDFNGDTVRSGKNQTQGNQN